MWAPSPKQRWSSFFLYILVFICLLIRFGNRPTPKWLWQIIILNRKTTTNKQRFKIVQTSILHITEHWGGSTTTLLKGLGEQPCLKDLQHFIKVGATWISWEGGRYHSKGISFQRRNTSWVPIDDIVWLKGPEVHQLCLILPDGRKPMENRQSCMFKTLSSNWVWMLLYGPTIQFSPWYCLIAAAAIAFPCFC